MRSKRGSAFTDVAPSPIEHLGCGAQPGLPQGHACQQRDVMAGAIDLREVSAAEIFDPRQMPLAGLVNGDHTSFTLHAAPLLPENKINRL